MRARTDAGGRARTRAGKGRTRTGRAVRRVDDRLQMARPIRRLANVVFPDHWSFMIGEIALYSLVVTVLTGVYLTFFFDPSMTEVVYNGGYVPLKGVAMSKAYASTLHISFDVRGGLIVRQIHYWSGLLFIAAILVHMLRVFFTGGFRRPREIQWLLGIAILILGVVEAWLGKALPNDLISGTGLRVANSIMLSIPVFGTWLTTLAFGGEFPGTDIIGRVYIAHVLLVPAILGALFALYLLIARRQGHADFPGPGKRESTVTGVRFLPTKAARSVGLALIVFGVLAMLGGLAQINPVWLYGPYQPAQVSSSSGPDWYLGLVEGLIRLMPPWNIRLLGHDITPTFWAAIVIPTLLITLALIYPFLEARLTHDRARHNLLQRPRDAPVRAGLGAMALTFCLVLFISGGNDLIAAALDISLDGMMWAGRIALVLLPPIAYAATYRICLGLQRHDRDVLDHGIETGIIKRLPDGGYIEVLQPLGPVGEDGHGELEYAGAPVPKRMNQVGRRNETCAIGFFVPSSERPPARSEDR